jgi:hypothetical protein
MHSAPSIPSSQLGAVAQVSGARGSIPARQNNGHDGQRLCIGTTARQTDMASVSALARICKAQHSTLLPAEMAASTALHCGVTCCNRAPCVGYQIGAKYPVLHVRIGIWAILTIVGVACCSSTEHPMFAIK